MYGDWHRRRGSQAFSELRFGGLQAGRWTSAAHVAAWLEETHGISRSRKSIYYWFAKLGLSAAEATPSPPSKAPVTVRRSAGTR